MPDADGFSQFLVEEITKDFAAEGTYTLGIDGPHRTRRSNTTAWSVWIENVEGEHEEFLTQHVSFLGALNALSIKLGFTTKPLELDANYSGVANVAHEAARQGSSVSIFLSGMWWVINVNELGEQAKGGTLQKALSSTMELLIRGRS